MGYSFAAGTTDGPGAFDFSQGTTSGNPLWNMVRNFLAKPTNEDQACHAPKPILLATGRANFPFQWQPRIVPTQLFQIGDVIMVGLPGEFTTMSGRRVRNAVQDAALQSGFPLRAKVILAGLSNIYTSYIATPEEYQKQRYEAASTIFGPHTLSIYLTQFEQLTQAMIRDERVAPGPSPPVLDDKVISFTPPVVFDGTPFGKYFGYVTLQPHEQYDKGDRVVVHFMSANPRNNLKHESTYFTVERQVSEGEWGIVATDAGWDTK